MKQKPMDIYDRNLTPYQYRNYIPSPSHELYKLDL
jgi:hypothetical protein